MVWYALLGRMSLSHHSQSEDSDSANADDDDSISAIFDSIGSLAIDDNQVVKGYEDDASALTSCTARSEQRKLKRRSKRTKSNKSQHSLEHLRQRISHLMSIFERHGWFVPLPDTPSSSRSNGVDNKLGNKKGKTWSNRNYGADKKRQRKQREMQMLEERIVQLELVLRDDHGHDNP